MVSSVLSTFATAFILLLVAELPDKTTLTTLMLTARFRTSAVLTAAFGAFALQTLFAVAFGGVLTLLPELLVTALVGGMFGVGAVLLLRGTLSAETETDAAGWSSGRAPFRRAVVASFGVLFVAEWGDASQLATAAMAARSSYPLAVGLGAFLSLMCVTGLAVALGYTLRKRLRPRLIQKAAGFTFAGFAVLTLGSMFV